MGFTLFGFVSFVFVLWFCSLFEFVVFSLFGFVSFVCLGLCLFSLFGLWFLVYLAL